VKIFSLKTKRNKNRANSTSSTMYSNNPNSKSYRTSSIYLWKRSSKR